MRCWKHRVKDFEPQSRFDNAQSASRSPLALALKHSWEATPICNEVSICPFHPCFYFIFFGQISPLLKSDYSTCAPSISLFSSTMVTVPKCGEHGLATGNGEWDDG